MMIIDFADEENTYGRIETEEDPEKIENLLENYRKDKEDYNIDDFFDFLREKNIDFTAINIEADRVIHF